ncbi:MAG: DUF2971 domain-containing protein [Sphingomonadales bacterium]|nr:DUF2971 domain-containing protein [Sphingomonadales bacterium]
MTNKDCNIILPPSLYKYREPDIGKLEYILIQNELWSAKPSTFNDPFDCLPHVDLAGTYEEAKSFIDRRIARLDISLTRAKRRQLARQIEKEGLGSLDPAEGQGAWRQAIDQFGIISFSEDCTNILMWSHYAKNHTGVCLEFGTELAPTNLVAPVLYQENRPTFRPLDPDRTNLAERLLLKKASIWSYEREWRHIRIAEGNGRTSFPPSVLKTIILGAAATDSFEADVRKLLARRSSRIPIRRVRFDAKEFRLHIE